MKLRTLNTKESLKVKENADRLVLIDKTRLRFLKQMRSKYKIPSGRDVYFSFHVDDDNKGSDFEKDRVWYLRMWLSPSEDKSRVKLEKIVGNKADSMAVDVPIEAQQLGMRCSKDHVWKYSVEEVRLSNKNRVFKLKLIEEKKRIYNTNGWN